MVEAPLPESVAAAGLDRGRQRRRCADGLLGLAGVVCALAAAAAGCGTTRSSDTARTATEQLLMSSAIDKAVNEINLRPLAGKEVYLDTDRLNGFVDQNYVVSTLRQAMIANGVMLKPDRASARYIVEARAGVLGTNSSTVMLGVPATNLPTLGGAVPGVPSAIPEIPFAKTTRQWGVAKIALFAYNAQTGKPIWQSGTFPVASDAKNTWFFGAGPYQRGSIYGESKGGAARGMLPFPGESATAATRGAVPVTSEAVFDEPPEQIAARPDASANKPVANSPLTLTPPAPRPSAAPAPASPAPPPAPPPAVPQQPPPPAPPTSVPLDQPAPSAAAGNLLNALGNGQKLFEAKVP